MTNEELIAKIKAEIERLYNGEAPKHDQQCNFDDGYFTGIDAIAQFIDTLESEKPMQDGLEEEINRLWESFADEMEGPHNLFDVYARLARHFAQWGVEHLKKDEIPVPADLEEAADKYKKQVIEETKCHHNALTYAEGYEDALLLIPDAFIDGAKWQKEQDDRLVDIIYQQGIEKGKDDMKEQMLKDAVEGTVMDFSSNRPRPQVDVLLDPHKYHTGDKVRIIIVKEDEK